MSTIAAIIAAIRFLKKAFSTAGRSPESLTKIPMRAKKNAEVTISRMPLFLFHSVQIYLHACTRKYTASDCAIYIATILLYVIKSVKCDI